MKKRRLALALAGLAVVTLLPAAPALAAAKPTASASASTVQPPPGIKFDPGKARCTTVKTASGATEHCRQAAHLPLRDLTAAQRAQRKQMMTKLAAQGKRQAPAAPSATTPSASATPAAAGGPPAECGFSDTTVPPTYVASPSRLLSCEDGLWTVFDYEVIDGAFSLVGDFSFEDQAWITFSSSSVSWVHDMQTLSYGGDGTLQYGLDGTMASSCLLVTAPCTATSTAGPDPQAVFLAPGTTYSWEWNEQDIGPAATTAGSVDNLDADLGVVWDLNDGTQPWDTQETGGLYGRCDSVAVAGTKGCVDENFIPPMYISYAAGGASVDMVNYYEDNIAPYYGNQYSPDPKPLHRLTDPILSGPNGNNREIICGGYALDPAITADLAPYNDTDSCDEYPFASTYESGAMEDGADGHPKPYVTTGADCAQVTANYTPVTGTNATPVEPQEWAGVTLNSTGTGPCIRGHVPNKLNSYVGGKFRGLIGTARLIDKDAFWVQVTP